MVKKKQENEKLCYESIGVLVARAVQVVGLLPKGLSPETSRKLKRESVINVGNEPE